MMRNLEDELGFPTIEQIIAKGDSLNGVPMGEEEGQEWFERTIEANRAQKAVPRG
jgi:hypothetical protein